MVRLRSSNLEQLSKGRWAYKGARKRAVQEQERKPRQCLTQKPPQWPWLLWEVVWRRLVTLAGAVLWEWMGGGIARGDDLGLLTIDKLWRCGLWRGGQRLVDARGHFEGCLFLFLSPFSSHFTWEVSVDGLQSRIPSLSLSQTQTDVKLPISPNGFMYILHSSLCFWLIYHGQ